MVQQVDILIHNGTILTMDSQNSIIDKGILCINGDTIRYVGIEKEMPFEAIKTIDANGGLILPGLVNGHTHAAMSLFRGLGDDLPLMEWLTNYIFPAEKRIDKTFVYSGTLLACAEMILSGTTTFCDMYLFADEVASAVQKAGMRALLGEVLYDFPSPNYGPIEKGFEYSEGLIKKWLGHPLISIAVEPHSLYTCSPALLKKAGKMAERSRVPLIMHVSETLSEVKEIRNKTGKSPVEYLESIGVLGPSFIADHCVHLNDDEIKILADYGVKVIYNPESNMKLASGVAPIKKYLSSGICVGLGTDGCASNNNLDLFSEMDMAAKLAKIQAMDPMNLDAVSVLRMATIEGARAVGLDSVTGSLEKGKKADVIVLDTRKPHLVPMYNPYSHLVYAANGHDVIHSVINGRIVMQDRELLTIDTHQVMSSAKKQSRRVMRFIS